MNQKETGMRQATMVMRVCGWLFCVGLPFSMFIYPPGILWGEHPAHFPHIGPAHPESYLDGLHPYLFMLAAMYVALGILLVRGARDPIGNRALFDYTILANLLHGAVMIPQAFYYPNEHAHLWTDIPFALATVVACWYWHPNRILRRANQ